MVAIGGKTKQPKAPTKPQVVIQRGYSLNEYALIEKDDKGEIVISWVGDSNAASKFESKYDAKNRTRHIDDIPENRVFKVLEKEKSR